MAKETTRLMVLGIVAYRGPVGGYGIERILEEWAVARWTTIAPASIYQQLRSLSASGLIRESSAPRTRASEFEATDEGRERLHTMLLALLDEPRPQPMSLVPLLHFTPSLEEGELIDGLTARIHRIDEALANESAFLTAAEQNGPPHVVELFRLTLEGLRADRRWCVGYLERLSARSDAG